MTEPILTGLSIVLGFVISYLKIQKSSNKGQGELGTKIDAVAKGLSELDTKVAEIADSHTVENRLWGALTRQAIELIELNEGGLDSKILKIINTTKNKIRVFAVEHFTSHYREKGSEEIEDIEKYLQNESADIVKRIEFLALNLYPQIKEVQKNGKSVKMNYHEYTYYVTDVEYLVKAIVKDLTTNGYDNEQYIDLFLKFQKQILKLQIKANKKWLQI